MVFSLVSFLSPSSFPFRLIRKAFCGFSLPINVRVVRYNQNYILLIVWRFIIRKLHNFVRSRSAFHVLLIFFETPIMIFSSVKELNLKFSNVDFSLESVCRQRKSFRKTHNTFCVSFVRRLIFIHRLNRLNNNFFSLN